MQKLSSFSERLNYLALKKGVTPYVISKETGISEATLSKVLNGRTKKMNERSIDLLSFYFRANKDWLRNGEGDIYQTSISASDIKADRQSGVPYFAVDFLAGFDSIINDQTSTPSGYVDFPHFRGAQCWVDISGKSMSPLIDPGDVIAIKRVDDWLANILYGEVYAIVTNQYRTVKRIRKSERDGWIRLVPENPDYDPQDIPAESVTAVFQVLGCAKKIF